MKIGHKMVKAYIVSNPPSYANKVSWRASTLLKLESDEHIPYTCPQCESLDPDEQCDSCGGCENCLEFCSHCENPICVDCCSGHDSEE